MLPRQPRSPNNPTPNQPFSYPETYYLQGGQGFLPLGDTLYINPATGAFTNIEPSPYIYCVPQFGNLPVTYPPYGCETEVNTTGVTDFTRAWYSCYGITVFPCVDSSSVTDFTQAWAYSYNIVSFPALDTSSGVSFREAWAEFFYATSFPLIDVSKGEDFNYAWGYWENLVSFPLLDVSSGLDFGYAWSNCTSLTSFPTLDVSQGTNFSGAWWVCNSLTSFPLLDVSSGKNFGYAWQNCTSLTSFPQLDVSSGTDFDNAWANCTSLTSFPLLDVSQGAYFYGAWQNCTSLTIFPAGMFDSCSTNNNQAFREAWHNCALNQTSVNNILVSLDTSGIVNNYVNIDGGTSAAPSLTGWNAVASLEGKGWTVVVNGVSPFSVLSGDKETNFPENPEPFQDFSDPATGQLYKWSRAR